MKIGFVLSKFIILTNEIYSMIREEFFKQVDFICVNTDLWTSIRKDEYICVIASKVDKQFQKTSKVIYITDIQDVHVTHAPIA